MNLRAHSRQIIGHLIYPDARASSLLYLLQEAAEAC